MSQIPAGMWPIALLILEGSKVEVEGSDIPLAITTGEGGMDGIIGTLEIDGLLALVYATISEGPSMGGCAGSGALPERAEHATAWLSEDVVLVRYVRWAVLALKNHG